MIVCKDICKSYRMGHGRKHVLRDINLRIEPADKIAFLGRNGAGKSTLIKMIGGVEMPTSGKIRRQMSVSWPLGFNGGFQGSLTGYDNARFISRIYGKHYAWMKEFVEDFTELGRQLSMPVKTYSSGMRARLAFALSLAIEFDCYLIDEIILVGDSNFREKCQRELFEKRKNRAFILASHDMGVIQEFCNRAVVLKDGQATDTHDVAQAIAEYQQL
ncbi:capsular polysaccharide transport system ATP-binding protein [Novosphingobium sp. CF614]|uniref:ABC transporter ATP-binding protein n=1 Tax=Novosphingobium sp. CF614 TaxID=1884364 RepID=UPI0008DF5EFC|nr:ABC transporter ATP-binding protein [Novosphingobium sp. CF614]SFG19721.1 capsular polysaccharide transport system ATP-binding protein [Novosphingobium sp. CF614]